jgi:hypothetical protein
MVNTSVGHVFDFKNINQVKIYQDGLGFYFYFQLNNYMGSYI